MSTTIKENKNSGLASLKGVGASRLAALKQAGIDSISDLLMILPRRYEDHTKVSSIADSQPGSFVLLDVIVKKSSILYKPRRMLYVEFTDSSGESLTARWFHFYQGQSQAFKVGNRFLITGNLANNSNIKTMVHPQYQSLKKDQKIDLAQAYTPIYPTLNGLSSSLLEKLIKQALPKLKLNILEYELPALILDKYHLPTLSQALNVLHQPPLDIPIDVLNALELDGEELMLEHEECIEQIMMAKQRLVMDELLAQHCALRQAKSLTSELSANPIPVVSQSVEKLTKTLPFTLTAAQQRVITEISNDMQLTAPMMRLVQGDVGCGKTVISVLAAVAAVDAGYQVAMMAPTEILAEQHYENFVKMLELLNIECVFLSGKQKAKAKRESLAKIQSGQAKIVIGTHALLQDGVEYHNLALVIIDEQHRFGVKQRLSLRNKGREQDSMPHQLLLTATPIPRTIAMTSFADCAISIVDELPPGRTPIQTVVMANDKREQVCQRIQSVCQRGEQVYWVCTLIEENEEMPQTAATQAQAWLQQQLPQQKIGLIHGKLKADEKDTIMQSFKRAEIDVLVATTVIEVGVDVPNASLMVIENPERLGLAQLHQLRGRVGRGSLQSYCLLMYQTPLSQMAKQRLQVMRDSQDGFYIAEQDLKLRGPGEILGTAQTGLAQLSIANWQRDSHLLPQVVAIANQLYDHYPEIVEAILKCWMQQKAELLLA